jgi:hypothetical protein
MIIQRMWRSTWLVAMKRTPVHTVAYACRRCTSLTYSFLRLFLNAFARTGSDLKRSLILAVVPGDLAASSLPALNIANISAGGSVVHSLELAA